MTTKFQLSEIPYAQFAEIGMNKQAVQKLLSMDDMERLMNGEKTNLKKITTNTDGISRDNREGVQIDTVAKFFLQRTVDNKVELRIIEQSQQIENRFKVSNENLERLQKGATVLERENKTNQPYLYQLDSETNSIMRVNQSKMIVPDVIENIQLSQNQKEALRNGQSIELKKGDDKFDVKLDFNKKGLFKVEQTAYAPKISQNQTLKTEKPNTISTAKGIRR
jgi:Protein of unknown function (DUF3945)/Protein of unknown function (DUF4099)